MERLFSSSLVAIVSLKAPRKLKVCHFKKGTEICNYSYSNTILAVKLNRQVRNGGIILFLLSCCVQNNLWHKYFNYFEQVAFFYNDMLFWSSQYYNCLFSPHLEIDSMPGGEFVHSQYPRYESTAHHSGNTTKSHR